MKVTILQQQGNNLKLKFDIALTSDKKFSTLYSKKYLCGAVYFQLRTFSVTCTTCNDQSYPDYTEIAVNFTKLFKDDNLKYTCKFSSPELDNVNQTITKSNTTWYIIYHHMPANVNGTGQLTFEATFQSDISTTEGPFASLYEDDSPDFSLCGEDGSVKLHKLILKVCSPVLHGMLNGEWKETSEGQITIADVSKDTCDHFKEYIYLDKLPNTNIAIQKLLILGSHFLMPDLVQKCLVKLLNNLNADNIAEITEFACNYKVTNLFVALMSIVQNGVVKINHLSQNTLLDMCHATNSTLNIKK